MGLSNRLRANIECAPWVIKEVKSIEAENSELKRKLEEEIRFHT